MTYTAVLWIRFKSKEDAKKSAERYQECPKIHFWGNKDEEAYIILKVPDDNKFWSDFIKENPESSFGGVEAKLKYLEELFTPKKISVSYAKVEGDVSPCGSKCGLCPSKEKCSGCPSLELP